MVCQRCRGLLVRETFDGLSQEAGIMCLAIRCINCGYIEDSVVRANRLLLPATKRVGLRGIVRKGEVLFLRPYSERYCSI
jgi:RNase P subunit RPR2